MPRVVFYPVYLTTEYLLRWPIGHAIAAAERAHLPQEVYDFFFFGPNHKAGVVPIGFIDFGFNPSVGLYAFWDDALFAGNDVRVHATGWPSDWIAGALTESIRFRGEDTLTLSASAIRRPDHVFYGLGPRTLESAESRYGEDKLEASATFGLPLWRTSRVDAGIGVRSASLYNGHYGGDPSIEVQAARGVFSLPVGFGRGYTAEYNHVLAALDTRRPRPAPGSGVRLEAEAEQGNDVRRRPAGGWIRYSGTARGFVDLDGHNRVLSLAVTAIFADPLGNEPIPFTELASVGGNGPMRGFFPGRVVDRSVTAATLHYRWPIWVWLDGALEGSVGNAFGEHLDGWKPSLLRFSSAIGVESVGARDNSVEILVGVGSETFEHGAQVDSLRVSLGTNHGF